jgi:DNA-binding FadR family transcriptional regulator
MREALADAPAYVRLDTAFHLQLAEATGNVLIVHLMRSIRGILEASIDEGFRSRREPARIQAAHERHERLVDELERRDAEAAATTMDAHFEDAVASLRRAAAR